MRGSWTPQIHCGTDGPLVFQSQASRGPSLGQKLGSSLLSRKENSGCKASEESPAPHRLSIDTIEKTKRCALQPDLSAEQRRESEPRDPGEMPSPTLPGAGEHADTPAPELTQRLRGPLDGLTVFI